MEEILGEHAPDLVERLSVGVAVSIVGAMESAEQADVLADMSEAEAEASLARMDPERTVETRELVR